MTATIVSPYTSDRVETFSNLKCKECGAEYEAKAILFAKEKLLLSQIKTKLNKNLITSPLFNTVTYTKYLEMGLLEAYKRYHSGKILNHIFIH